MKQQEELKTKEDVIDFIKWYISFRGGMSNRIDARDILDLLEGKNKRYYKRILIFSKEIIKK
jgi:hypothetical protein